MISDEGEGGVKKVPKSSDVIYGRTLGSTGHWGSPKDKALIIKIPLIGGCEKKLIFPGILKIPHFFANLLGRKNRRSLNNLSKILFLSQKNQFQVSLTFASTFTITYIQANVLEKQSP